MSDNFDGVTLPTLAWQLDVYSPMGSLVTSVTQATSPNPIMGSPTAIVGECGRTKEIRFNAKQSILGVTPRQIVRYSAAPSSTPVAAGVVVTCPPTTSLGAGPADSDADALQRISCVGLEQLLKESIVGSMLFEESADISTIAYELCNEFAHPALVIDVGNFPASGFEIGAYYAPYKTLYDVLEFLIKQLPAGGCFNVNASMNVVWSPNAISLPM